MLISLRMGFTKMGISKFNLFYQGKWVICAQFLSVSLVLAFDCVYLYVHNEHNRGSKQLKFCNLAVDLEIGLTKSTEVYDIMISMHIKQIHYLDKTFLKLFVKLQLYFIIIITFFHFVIHFNSFLSF